MHLQQLRACARNSKRTMQYLRTTVLLLFCGIAAHAQKPVTAPATTITVVGSPEPVTLGESERSTVVLDTQQEPLAYGQTEEYLRTDSSLFVAQRGAGGSQADLSVRGTSFEQTLLLLNGLRISDAETTHNNMDLPVPLAAMRSIDVLHGAGSTLYGSDAIGGVVDFVTAEPAATSFTLRAGGGSYGSSEQQAIASFAGKRWSQMFAGQRDASSGFRYDRDYDSSELSSETRWHSPLGVTDVLLAGNDRQFGADQFYGNYPSWERTKGWFASVQQALGEHTSAAFGYRRHTDEYILFRSDPTIYENNHVDTSWQAVLRRKDAAGSHVRLFYGLESDGDAIRSTNLGRHARNWGSGYLDAEAHWSRTTLSAGLREEILGHYRITSPMLALGFHATEKLKLRAESGYGFRLPTYLDLYYSDPTTIGNAALKPESAWNAEGGADLALTERLYLNTTVFYSRQHNAIDYVRADATQKWQATNLSGLRFLGWETSGTWQPNQTNRLRASWTLLAGAQRALQGLQSEYVFNYPVNNASLEASHIFRAGLQAHTRIGVTQRYQQSPYAVWDVSLAREPGRLQPYVRLTNVTNTGYQEVLNVQMPGRTIIAGMQFTFARH